MFKDILEGKPLRHPLHPFLVHFPIGFFILSMLLDLATFVFPSTPNLVRSAFYAMLLGIITALIAAVPGLVDFTDIRADHPGKRIATVHLILNLIVVALYAINMGVRWPDLEAGQTAVGPFVLSLAALILLSVSGYLGGRLVYDEGISVGRHKRRTRTPVDTLHFPAQSNGNVAWVLIPEAKGLRENETLRVEIDGEVIAVAKIDNRIYAFQEFCTHRFGPLSEGSFNGFNVQCPWHNSCFDVRTGKVSNGPAKIDLKTFEVETRDGGIWIGIPPGTKNA